jgi:hypothetical protein
MYGGYSLVGADYFVGWPVLPRHDRFGLCCGRRIGRLRLYLPAKLRRLEQIICRLRTWSISTAEASKARSDCREKLFRRLLSR